MCLFLGCFVTVALVVLAGCAYDGENSTSEHAADSVLSTGNRTNDTLLGLSAGGQETALAQAVGEGCIADRAFYNGIDKEHDGFWSIGCSNGNSYMVEVKPDAGGSTKVMDCSTISAVAGLTCFEKFKTP